MDNIRVLLADDDVELSDLLQRYLSSHALRCDCVYDGETALQRLATDTYDLMVLDIMMPKRDGLSVLKQLAVTRALPIIMLTAKGDEIDRIVGLELGADDYVVKPCNPRELLARIHAVLKRTKSVADSMPLPASRLTMHPQTRTSAIDGVPLDLTGTEFDLLLFLLRHKGQVVSKEQLSLEVLQRALQPFDRSIDVHISRLRKKLQPFDDEPIKAIRGKGYQLVL